MTTNKIDWRRVEHYVGEKARLREEIGRLRVQVARLEDDWQRADDAEFALKHPERVCRCCGKVRRFEDDR